MMEEGNYVKVIGFKVKNDNDIFVVKHKYKEGEYCLYKVTQNGEESKVKYNIVFLKEKHFNDPELIIEVITKDELKRAKKEVNNYLKGITNDEKVYSFNEIEGWEIEKGSYFKVIKSIQLTSSIYSVPKNTIYICSHKNEYGYTFHMLGKKGEPLSTYNASATNKILLNFNNKLVQQLFNEKYIVKVERIEQTKGEVETNNSEEPEQIESVEQPEAQEQPEQIKEKQKEVNNNDDILSKFDSFEVENTSRITAEDQEFCEEQEKEYNEFIKFSDDYLKYLEDNKFQNLLYKSSRLIDEMITERQNKMSVFINKIVSYFRDKYNVTLSSDVIAKKYDIEIDYNTIVTEIIEQLGGYSFNDKAEKEIKDEFKDTLKYDKVKIKNNKITIEDFFSVDLWDIKYGSYTVSYSSDNKFYKLFKAVSHFLFKSNQSYFDRLFTIITREKNDDVFTTHNIANDGAKTLKLFKNGRIDLEFSSNEYARQFAKEYCGYIEQAA